MKIFKGNLTAEQVKANQRRFAFTFPGSEAELTDDTIADLDMTMALTRFARRLLTQYQIANGKPVVGVELHNIGVTFILDAEEKP